MDAEGRTIDEARETGFPEFAAAITEEQPVVAPGPASYSTRKVALERALLDGAKTPAAILRPCAVHGPGSRAPREWFFVKRLLDGRTRIPLAYKGESRFHTAAAINIAALLETLAGTSLTGIWNIADPETPSVAEIARAIMDTMGRTAELVPLKTEGYPPRAGVTPWSLPHPVICSTQKACRAGYRPESGYAAAVKPLCDWLAASIDTGDWREDLPGLAAYPWNLFDYAAEDAVLAGTPREH